MDDKRRSIVTAAAKLAIAAVFIAGVAIGVTRLASTEKPDDSENSTNGDLAFAPLTRLGPLDSNSPQVGEAAPDFVLQSIDGKTTKLSDFRGTPVIVNFWATWCGPCKQELPAFDAAHKAKQGNGLMVLAIDYQESTKQARTFLDEQKLSLPVLMDTEGSVAQTYRITGLPVTYFIGADGLVKAVTFGVVTHDDLLKKLDLLGVELPAGALKEKG